MIPIICSDAFWECRASTWIWRTIPLILLVVGTVGNILNIIVLSRRELRKYSTSVYMLVLAIADLLTLWSILLESTLKNGYGIVLIDLYSFSCRTAAWIAYSSGSLSTLTIANMSMERLIMTKFPFWARQRIKPKVAVIVSLVTVFVIQAMNGHLFYGHQLKTFPSSGNGTGAVIQRCYMTTPAYARFYFTTWNTIVLLVYNVAPSAIIITGNAIIGISLIQQRRKFVSMPQQRRNQSDMKKENSAVKTLLGISIFFVVCTTPYCIYFVILDFRFYLPTSHEAAVAKLVNTTIHILLFINYTFNFFLYFHRATHFRNEWIRMVKNGKDTIVLCMDTCCRTRNAIVPMGSPFSSRQAGNVTQPSTVQTSVQVPRSPNY